MLSGSEVDMEHGLSRGNDPQGHGGVGSRSGVGPCGGSVTELVERLSAAWQHSDALIALVRDQTLLTRPFDDHPPFAYELAHPAAVAHALVCQQALGDAALDTALDARLSATETATPPGARWPRVAELKTYRDRLRAAVIAAAPRCATDTRPLLGALEHELHHQEVLLTMLWRLEGSQKSSPGKLRPPEFGQAAPRRQISIPAGIAHCGSSGAALAVDAFEIDSTPVMNGEYFEFVVDGAYGDERWWTPEGWSWRRRLGRRHPCSWRQLGSTWLWRGLFEDLPLTRVFDWPAIVSRAEAQAFLAWRGQRLPSEGEYCRAAFSTCSGGLRRYPWGEGAPDPATANLGQCRHTPIPVGSLPAGASDWGVLELLGNGWEWTVESRDATRGRGSAVLLGGSWATAAALVGRGCRRIICGPGDGRFTKFRGVSPSGS